MNPFAIAALTCAFATSIHAQTALPPDNFSTEASFTASPNADQGGSLAPASYIISGIYGGTANSVRGAGVLEISKNTPGNRVLPSVDYITHANAHNTAIQFSFDYDSSNTGNGWVGFTVGTDTAEIGQLGSFGALFKSGNIFNFNNNGIWGTGVPLTPATITLELRGSDGGSAFDGGGSVAQIWAGDTSIGTYTLVQLDANNGKFAFASNNQDLGAGGTFDNFIITATLGGGSDYDTWKSANGVTGTATDDDDNDGLTNFKEYAFGLNPTAGSSVNPISVVLDKTSKTFIYTRRTISLSAPAFDYSVWFSTNLGAWTKDTGTSQMVTGTSGQVETVQTTLSALPGDPLPDKLFIQIRAELP